MSSYPVHIDSVLLYLAAYAITAVHHFAVYTNIISQKHHVNSLHRNRNMHRPAIFLAMLLAASLAGHAQAADDTLQFTENFLKSRIGYNLKHISENMQAAMAGQLKHLPVQAPKQVGLRLGKVTKTFHIVSSCINVEIRAAWTHSCA